MHNYTINLKQNPNETVIIMVMKWLTNLQVSIQHKSNSFEKLLI